MQDVTDRNFDDVVLRTDGAVVVDFWAPWCGPCKAIEPALAQLADEHLHVRFVRLDVDANPETANRYGVLSLPTVMLFERGRPRETLAGARSRTHYERAFAPWLEMAPAAEA